MAGVRHNLLAALRDTARGAKGMRRVTRFVPARHSCKNCLLPFDGIFSLPLRILQIRASRKNPHLCNI